MTLIESIMTKNPCYTAGRKISVQGLMLHSVGCPQPSASVFIRDWNRTDFKSACVHAFIDANDGTVDQASTAGGKNAKRLVCADDKTDNVGLVRVESQGGTQSGHLGVLTGGVDDGVVIVDVLGLAVVELFTPQRLREGGLACRYATHQN